MNRSSLLMMGAAVVLGVTGLCAAQNNTNEKDIEPLTIGDKARDIDIAHWVKPGRLETTDDEGAKHFEPLTSFDKGKVYVLEFWATWCGPCVASMPHLSELQEKYADYDVTFIGVSDEPLNTVVEFLFKEYKADGKIHNDRSRYTLTTDPDESVKNAYFKAAGQRGIPCAFIIGKDNRVEWIGHPMTIDEPLDKVVRDDWDRDAFKAKWEEENAVEREMASMQQKYMAAMAAKDYDKALATLDGALENHPDNIQLQYMKFMLLASQMDKPKEAYALAGRIGEANWDNQMLLNQIAWTIVDNPELKTRDYDVALSMAKRASELTDDKDPAILDTLARVYYEKKDLKNAIKYQELAVKHAGEGPMGDEIRATLEKYKSEKK